MRKIINYLLVVFFIGIFLVSHAHAEQSKQVDVIFLGNMSSGKTWLRARLLGEDPATFDSEYRLTTDKVNSAFSSTTVNGNQVSLLYWDSPGNPEVHDQLLTFGAQGCQFIVLTVDLKEHTLGSPIASERVDVVEDLVNNWLMAAARQYPEAHIIVVGTKKDEVSPAVQQAVLSRLNFFKTYGRYSGRLDCILTSAKTDRNSVMEIERIIKRVLGSWTQSRFSSLPIFTLPKNGDEIKLPCGKSIIVKKGLCTLL